MLRWMVGLTFGLAFLYGGYWFIGSASVERQTRGALEELRAQGWEIGDPTVNTRGFPSRFDTTIEPLRLRTPDGLTGVSADFVQTFALSYRPGEMIVVLPGLIGITLGGRSLELTNDDLRASGAVSLGGEMPLDRVTAEAERLEVRPAGFGAGPRLAIFGLLAALRLSPGTEASYDLHLRATDIGDSTGSLVIDALQIDGRADLGAPLALRGEAPPRLERLSITALSLTDGPTRLTLAGTIAPDPSGFASGDMTLDVQNAAPLLEALAQWEGVTAQDIATVRGILALAETGGGLTITLADGWASAGGVPLFPAPRLYRQ